MPFGGQGGICEHLQHLEELARPITIGALIVTIAWRPHYKPEFFRNATTINSEDTWAPCRPTGAALSPGRTIDTPA